MSLLRARLATFTHGLVCALLLLSFPLAAQEAEKAAPVASEKPRLLVLDLKSEGVDPKEVATLNGVLTVLFSQQPTFDVIAGADLRQLLDLEAERQAMDCSDASCLAEISDAMGAEYIVFGSIGVLGEVHVINLNLYDSQLARPLSRTSVHVQSLEQAADVLDVPVARLVDIAVRSRKGEKVESGFVQRSDRLFHPYAVMGVGMGLAFVGGAATALIAVVPALLVDNGPHEAATAVHSAETPVVEGVDPRFNWFAVAQWGAALTGVAAACVGLGAAGYGAFLLAGDEQE